MRSSQVKSGLAATVVPVSTSSMPLYHDPEVLLSVQVETLHVFSFERSNLGGSIRRMVEMPSNTVMVFVRVCDRSFFVLIRVR